MTGTLEAVLLPSEPSAALRAPRLRLLANDKVIAGALEAEVISNNYYAADRFSAAIALGSEPSLAAAFWASETNILLDVQLSVDGGDSFTSLVQGAVDTIRVDPTLGLVHLDGRDLTASLIETRTQEAFPNRTASEIASVLAARHNLTAHVTSTTTPVGRYYDGEHDSITLNEFSRVTTEWDLLVLLARHEGFDVFIQGQNLYFQPATGGTGQAISLRPSDVTELQLERSLTLARDIEVVVKSWNARQNSAFIQRARADRSAGSRRTSAQPQRYVFVRPNLTSAEALKLAQRKLSELSRHERTIRITMPGELTLTPRSLITLEGTGTEFDQLYYVDVVERRLRRNGGLLQHILARNASPAGDVSFGDRI